MSLTLPLFFKVERGVEKELYKAFTSKKKQNELIEITCPNLILQSEEKKIPSVL